MVDRQASAFWRRAALDLPGNDPNQRVDQRPQTGRDGAAQGRTVLAGDIRGECRVDASLSPPVPVPGRQIRSSKPLSGASGCLAAITGQVSADRASTRSQA